MNYYGKDTINKEAKKMQIISAFSLYKEMGEECLRDTYPKYVETILDHKHLTLNEFISLNILELHSC